MVFVGLSNDELAAVSLPFVQPHIAAKNYMSAHTATVYNCMEGKQALHPSIKHTKLINKTIKYRTLRFGGPSVSVLATWRTRQWENPLEGCTIFVRTHLQWSYHHTVQLGIRRGKWCWHVYAASVGELADHNIQPCFKSIDQLTDRGDRSSEAILCSGYYAVAKFWRLFLICRPKRLFRARCNLKTGPSNEEFFRLTINEEGGAAPTPFTSFLAFQA